MPLRTFTCQNPACGKVFARYHKGRQPRPKFCCPGCNATVNRPSQALIIPDGAPMSRATQQRRRAAERLKRKGPG